METLLVYPEKKKELQAVKAVLKALNIRFEAKTELSYDPEFVDMVKQADKDIEEGRGIKLDIKNLWK